MTFQRDFTVWRALQLLSAARRDPVSGVVLRVEPRLLTTADGAPLPSPGGGVEVRQFGFDIGWDLRPGRVGSRVEVKLNPTAKDVREFVARLPALMGHGFDDGSVSLVAGRVTSPVRSLQLLAARAAEAGSEDEFAGLVEMAVSDDGSARQLLTLSGPSPWAALRLVTVTEFPPLVLSEAVAASLAALATADQMDGLRSAVTGAVEAAAPTRGTVLVGPLAAKLIADGVLQPAGAVDLSQTPVSLFTALAVLRVCPLPVPPEVLAAAAGVELGAVGSLLADQVDLARVAEVDGDFFAVFGDVLPEPAGFRGAAEAALVALTGLVTAAGPARAEQSANALALAKRVVDGEVVARLFKVFDKPAKAFGELSVVFDLAELSDAAARRVGAAAPVVSDEWVDLRAHARICGTGWVLQRVGELDEAIIAMDRAQELGEVTGNADNIAFAAKCNGRLLRMRGEQEPEGSERSSLLQRSVDSLEDAFVKFEALMVSRAGLDEDLGECVSLSAHTLFTMGERDRAVAAAARARVLLRHLPSTKAFADLVILEALMAVRDREDGDGVDLRGRDDALVEVFAVHRPGTDAARTRSSSEVAARVLLARAEVAAAERRVEDAVGFFGRAADLLDALRHDTAADAARWSGFVLQPDRVPAGLTAALERVAAVSGVRVRAVQIADRLRSAESLDAAACADETSGRWEGIAVQAQREHSTSSTRWSELHRNAE